MVGGGSKMLVSDEETDDRTGDIDDSERPDPGEPVLRNSCYILSKYNLKLYGPRTLEDNWQCFCELLTNIWTSDW